MKEYSDSTYDQERALYGIREAIVRNCRFEGPADGESALKECSDLTVEDCRFDLRYPLWHLDKGRVSGIEMTPNCRAAMWYCSDMSVSGSVMNGIKAVRECVRTVIADTKVDSPEFGWKCRDLTLRNVDLTSEYPFLDTRNLVLDHVKMNGKYSFQYVEDCEVKDSELHTKDAFWHSRNVTVTDSVVDGEYLGWYSENLRLVRCRIRGTQPLCYCRGLVLEDCTMEGCDLSFERSEVTASVKGGITSVKNPLKGEITADSVGELILNIPEAEKGGCRVTVRE